MNVNKALLKNGYSSFSLYILEYCDGFAREDLIKREQYYIDLLKPEYNILKIAGSSLGYKHTEENLAKMSEANKKREKHPMSGKQHSNETIAKISNSKIGLFAGGNNPMFSFGENRRKTPNVRKTQTVRVWKT